MRGFAARGDRRRNRHAVSLVAAILALVSYPSRAQVPIFIPPPDDVIEVVPILPPSGNPAIPAPAPPPPPAFPVSMTRAEAEAEAKAFGGARRADFEDLTQAPDAAAQVPNYNGVYPASSAYYDNPAGLAGAGAAAAVSSEGFATVHDPNRPVVNVTRDDMSRALTIAEDPQSYLEGQNVGGTSGNCVPLPPGSGGANYAEWTCNVGSGVVERPQTCTRDLTVTEWNALTYQYLCVISAGFDGCAGLAANTMCTKTATYPVPDFGLTVDLYDPGLVKIALNGSFC